MVEDRPGTEHEVGTALPLGGARQQRVLAVLLARVNSVVPTDVLVERSGRTPHHPLPVTRCRGTSRSCARSWVRRSRATDPGTSSVPTRSHWTPWSSRSSSSEVARRSLVTSEHPRLPSGAAPRRAAAVAR